MKPIISSSCNHSGKALSNQMITGLRLTEVAYNPGTVTPKHSHDQAGFCLVLRGSYTENYGKKVLECTPQTVTFGPAEDEHFNRFHNEATRCFIIDVKNEWLTRVIECGGTLNPVEIHRGSPVWLANRIYSEYNNPDQVSSLAIEALILEMLVQVSRDFPSTPNGKKPQRWLQQARIFINENFSK